MTDEMVKGSNPGDGVQVRNFQRFIPLQQTMEILNRGIEPYIKELEDPI